MKMIISGGLGYVGGRLSHYLAAAGHEVIALSRQEVTALAEVWPARLRVRHPDDAQLDELMNEADVFIHLAALNENDCMRFPARAIEVNITGTLRWLTRWQETGGKKFIYFSTAHVYDKPLAGYYEEDSKALPVHPYAITHRCAEDYVLAARREKKLDSLVIRLTNSFGGPAFPTADRWTLLVNDLCREAVVHGKLTLLSDGLQLRDFVCLQDVCRAVEHLTMQPYEQQDTGIYNVGAGFSESVWHMAQRIKTVAERKLERAMELTRKEPGVSSAAAGALTIATDKLRSTGFEWQHPVEAEIESTLAYFMKHAGQTRQPN